MICVHTTKLRALESATSPLAREHTGFTGKESTFEWGIRRNVVSVALSTEAIWANKKTKKCIFRFRFGS